MTRKLFLGVDVAAATLDAAWQCEQVRQVLGQFTNTPAGFEQLRDQLAAALTQPDLVVYLVVEPTGGYEFGLVAYARTQGWQVCLPNPKQVRDWAKGDGRRAKTDAQDAQLLAAFGAAKQPQPQLALPPEIQELADLLGRQEDLEKLLRMERNRLTSYQQQPQPSAWVLQSLQRTIATLQQELTDLNQQIDDFTDQQPGLRTDRERLRTVPGIGRKNVLPILVHLHRWQARTAHTGDAKGLVAFTGIDPQPFESGRSVYKRSTISRQGDARIRHLLYMGALGGKRAKGLNPLRTFYDQLVGRGKAKTLALVAAGRKILVWAWVVFTRQVVFDTSRYAITQAQPA